MMKIIKKSLLTLILLISINNNSFAECRCVCINREVVQMCDSQYDYFAYCYNKRC